MSKAIELVLRFEGIFAPRNAEIFRNALNSLKLLNPEDIISKFGETKDMLEFAY